MTELTYKTLDDHLKDFDPRPDGSGRPPAAVYLIFGEEMLCKSAFKKIVDKMVPPTHQGFNYEPVDGNYSGVSEAVEKLNTFSLLSGFKIVGLLDARLFDSKSDTEKFLLAAVQAYENQNLKRAADSLLRYMALTNLSFEDLEPQNREVSLPGGSKLPDDDLWLDEVTEFCREQGRQVPETAGSEDLLCRTIERGFPAGHCLLITTDSVDKRRKLFKTIRATGVIIDCSVPKGDRKADRAAQDAVLTETAGSILKKSGKSLAPDAYSALQETTGFELRAFVNNLEKLISYVGERDIISRQDIFKALKRTKRDPVYALTGAFAARNVDDALFYLNTLISDGPDTLRPEQLLTALLNQVRKLLVVKAFVAGPAGKAWIPGCAYNTFRTRVLPAIQKFDSELLETLQQWQDDPDDPVDGDGPPEKMRKRGRTPMPKTDVMIARHPNNPYPVYQLFINAENYSKEDLLQAYEYLSNADRRIKFGGDNKQLVIEEVILNICRRKQ